jgi:hydrogenase small subunit
MSERLSLGERLRLNGISRRAFMKFCASTASMMAIPPGMVSALADNLEKLKRPSVIWLSFQECTGCTESLTRSFSPSIESLIFDTVSLDYHHTLQAASGTAAETAKKAAMDENYGNYILIVDGSIPTGNPGYSTIAGIDNLTMLKETAAGAGAIIAVGTCATYGGLPMADPNPTGATSVADILPDRTIINIPGCPPIGEVMTGVLAQILAFGEIPKLDHLNRPMAFYGQNIHDRCYRRPFYERGLFAESFDDEGARKGWCLYKLGCKGPVTYNACAVTKWNGGVSFPIQAGHGCIGCSEPGFWDKGGFYQPLSQTTFTDHGKLGIAAAAGAAAGIGANIMAKAKQKKVRAQLAKESSS